MLTRTLTPKHSIALALVSVGALALPAGCAPLESGAAEREEVAEISQATKISPPPPEDWYTDQFRRLPSMSANLFSFVTSIPHPNDNVYTPVSATRRANFNAFIDALFEAIDAVVADPAAGDFCAVRALAAAADYSIFRFYDTTFTGVDIIPDSDPNGRWLIYGFDNTSAGESRFFINPFGKRNIVVEVPHAGFEADTDTEGVLIFRNAGARALIINGEHRCSSPDFAACSGTTTQCGGHYRESDV